MTLYDKFISILNNSKTFEFENGTTLVLTDYHTGEKIKLDLTNLDEDAFNSMVIKKNEDDTDD